MPPFSPPSSSTSTPTPSAVADLILHQPTAAAALQTFKWATLLPSFPLHDPAPLLALIRSLTLFRRLSSALPLILHHLPSTPNPSLILLPLLRALPPRRALHLLDKFSPNPPLPLLNSLLNSLVSVDIDLARRFFRQRISSRADTRTFAILMKGLCRTNRIADGFNLLSLVKKSSTNCPPNPVIYNTLIHALCRNAKVGRARSLMSEMPNPSDVTFNILISAYCAESNIVQALVMLEKSFDLGLVPDAIAVTKIVGLLCSLGRGMEAVEVLERVEKRGGVIDVVAYSTLISGFCRMGKPRVGLRVLREMESKGCLPNARTYNAMIAGFCDSGEMDSAMDLFREMRGDGVEPDFTTFDILVRGFCSGGQVDDGLKILSMMGNGGDHRISPYNSILYGLYKEGRFEEACEFLGSMEIWFPRAVERTRRILEFCNEGKVGEAMSVYEQMIREGDKPSTLVCCALIEGLCGRGSVREAFELMNEMVGMGYFPAVSTFNALISGFCREGKLRSAARLIEEMAQRGCCPDATSYNPLIGALCREGDVERALGYLVQMVERDVIPDHSTWSSLLSSEALWPRSKNKEMFDYWTSRRIQYLRHPRLWRQTLLYHTRQLMLLASWLKSLIRRIRIMDSIPIPLRMYCDNDTIVFLSD